MRESAQQWVWGGAREVGSGMVAQGIGVVEYEK